MNSFSLPHRNWEAANFHLRPWRTRNPRFKAYEQTQAYHLQEMLCFFTDEKILSRSNGKKKPNGHWLAPTRQYVLIMITTKTLSPHHVVWWSKAKSSGYFTRSQQRFIGKNLIYIISWYFHKLSVNISDKIRCQCYFTFCIIKTRLYLSHLVYM